MDDEGLLDVSDEENTIRETPMDQRDSLATFSRNLVHHLGIIGHNNIGSEKVNLSENQNVIKYNVLYSLYAMSNSLIGELTLIRWKHLQLDGSLGW